MFMDFNLLYVQEGSKHTNELDLAPENECLGWCWKIKCRICIRNQPPFGFDEYGMRSGQCFCSQEVDGDYLNILMR